MQKIFEMLRDETRVQRPVGSSFRKIYSLFSTFNGEFRRIQKIPYALVFVVQFTSNDDIKNFNKAKSKEELEKQLKGALADDLGKNAFEKMTMDVSFDTKNAMKEIKKGM